MRISIVASPIGRPIGLQLSGDGDVLSQGYSALFDYAPFNNSMSDAMRLQRLRRDVTRVPS